MKLPCLFLFPSQYYATTTILDALCTRHYFFHLKLLYTMAYTTYNDLEPMGLNGNRLENCTAAEDQAASPFYPEDMLRLTQQPGFSYLQKHMATFWGRRWQVWVGYTINSTRLDNVIVLRCPPYYPEYTTVGVKVTKNDPVRTEFMNNVGNFS
jgi:hypothetical protein